MSALSNLFLSALLLHFQEWSCSFSSTRHRRPRLVRNLTVRPKHLSDQNFDHDYYFKLPFQGADAQSSDDVLLHAMSDSELSRVRTELDQLANSPNRCATSSTTEHRAFWPSPPWQYFSVDASLGVHTDAASPHSYAPLLAMLLQQVAQQCLPCLLMCPSRCRPALEFFTGNQPNVFFSCRSACHKETDSASR